MNLNYICIYLVLFVGSVFIRTDACNGNGNKLVDEILANAKNDLNKQLVIPDRHEDPISIWNIRVWGLGSLSRGGDICLEDNKNGIVTVRSIMQVSNVKGSGSASYHLVKKVIFTKISMTWKGDFNVVLPYIRLRTGFRADLNNKKIDLIDFELEQFADAKVSIHMRGIWSVFDGIVSRYAQKHVNDKFKPKAKDLLKSAIETQLKKFDKWDLIKDGL